MLQKAALTKLPVREEIMNHFLKSNNLSLNVPAFTAVLEFSSGNDFFGGRGEQGREKKKE